jgi:hypothetical protein
MRSSPIAKTERRTSAKRCVLDCARDSSWPLEARSLGPGWFKGTAAAWPFRFRIEAVAFSISEQKFYSCLSFLIAAPEKPGQSPSSCKCPLSVQQVTRTLPIVFVQVADAVGTGFVQSLARPASNATGFTNFEFDISGKWLEVAQADCAKHYARRGSGRFKKPGRQRSVWRDPGPGTNPRSGGGPPQTLGNAGSGRGIFSTQRR